MKKYLKTTLGRKLLAFYLVLFAITFYLITTVGRDYISERVESESISNQTLKKRIISIREVPLSFMKT